MDQEALVASLQEAVPGAQIDCAPSIDLQMTIYVSADDVPALARALRDLPGFAFTFLEMPPPEMWRHRTKDRRHSVAFIFVILARALPGRGGQGRAHFAGELLAAFVQADQGPGGIGRAGIDFEHLLHRRHKLRAACGRNHPLLFLPRLELVFFSVWRTAS